MSTPFIIFALPRSRTAWLSYFLTYKDWHCSHDIVTDVHSIADLEAFFKCPNVGTAETGMIDGWKLIHKMRPDVKMVVIRRKITEVAESLAKFGIDADNDIIRRNNLLREVSALPGTLTISYDDLNREETCKMLFEHCLELPFDREHWLALKDRNIQVDISAWLEKLRKNHDSIQALKAEVAEALAA